MEAQEKDLGAEHLTTVRTKLHLAIQLRDEGHFTDSEILANEVLRVLRKALGSEHPQVLRAEIELVKILCDQGRLGEADIIARRVWIAQKKVLGHFHPATLSTQTILALASGEVEWRNRYWIPNLDIHWKVITQELQHYLGPDSTVHPYTRQDGFLITTPGNCLSNEQIDDICRKSKQEWEKQAVARSKNELDKPLKRPLHQPIAVSQWLLEDSNHRRSDEDTFRSKRPKEYKPARIGRV
ncbi:hypothetical protein NA56DRAFT_574672 [Hyaloscypha hepaticicola]|uniref:Kinesin light chain n=1 Tax=Hyaloscypha hepaticicola TaxID=2082293 RepID=A0A2J6Q130_9HELO|nr:hypothetical protein NA56DRAFT_574672 [Hyaloscypha hepaticicola]